MIMIIIIIVYIVKTNVCYCMSLTLLSWSEVVQFNTRNNSKHYLDTYLLPTWFRQEVPDFSVVVEK